MNRDSAFIFFSNDMRLPLSRCCREFSPIFYVPTTAHMYMWSLSLLTALMIGVFRSGLRRRMTWVAILAGPDVMSVEFALFVVFQFLPSYV